MSDSVHINYRLREARVQRNWRQKDLADELGTTEVTVNRWERGIQQPSAYFRTKLCALYGKSAQELGLLPETQESASLENDESAKKNKHEETSEPSKPKSVDEMHPPQENHPSPPGPFFTHPTDLSYQNRVRMLRRLRHSYKDLISQSLQGAVWLELDLASKPDAVQNATNLVWRMPNRAEQPLPSGTPMTKVYDDAEYELLILGEPGTGKSTLLLDLAQQLVLRAEQDKTHPLPVILPLSSWAIKRLPLQDWIAEQLTQMYDVPLKLSIQWVQEDGILPLLDGLDEMEETALPACIAAINTYHRDHLAKLVVCSRITEYETASEQYRLALQGAVVVQPLTHEHVDAYLIQAGEPLAALRSTLKRNNTLYDLATIPLMLNILILTYQGTRVRDLPNRESLLLQQVWDDYIQRMVTCKGNSNRYPPGETRAWLSYLAQRMREHNQTVFYLEHLQPDWLPVRQQRTYTWRAVRLPAIFIGILVSLLVFLFFFGSLKIADLSSYLQYALLGGILGWLWRGPASKREHQREQYHVRAKRLFKCFAIAVGIIVFDTVSLLFHLSTDPHYTLNQRLIAALFYGVVMGLSALLLLYVLTTPFHSDQSPRNSELRRFWFAVQGPHALLVAVVAGLSDALTLGQVYGPSVWLILGLSAGLIYGAISLALNAQMEDVRPTERLRWSWRSLGRGLFNSRHLRITGLLACIPIIGIGLDAGLSAGLSTGLVLGVSYWCLRGLYQGIAQERIENQDRRVANQGIDRSLRNGLIVGIISGAMIGIFGVLNFWLGGQLGNGLKGMLKDELSLRLVPGLSFVLSYGTKTEDISELSSVLGYGLALGVCGALLIYMLTGGLAALRHFIIRLLLWRSHTFPWPAPQFLDDATARFLLRRVGGGYSFSHRLLLNHFADIACQCENEAVPAASQFSHPSLQRGIWPV